MAGTKAGGQKMRQTMLAKLGGEEALAAHYRAMGRTGGLNGKGPGYTGGFAGDRDLARRAGAIGGSKSRRTKRTPKGGDK